MKNQKDSQNKTLRDLGNMKALGSTPLETKTRLKRFLAEQTFRYWEKYLSKESTLYKFSWENLEFIGWKETNTFSIFNILEKQETTYGKFEAWQTQQSPSKILRGYRDSFFDFDFWPISATKLRN